MLMEAQSCGLPILYTMSAFGPERSYTTARTVCLYRRVSGGSMRISSASYG